MYKDRGIIKWAPFDALVGFNAMITDLLYMRGKKEKPIILEDQLEMMNQTMMLAITYHMPLQITYYEDGYIKTIYDQVKRVDMIKRMVYLSSKTSIALDAICNLDTL